jgi:methylated-DNA-protein-cysteine methyltransferase related protein
MPTSCLKRSVANAVASRQPDNDAHQRVIDAVRAIPEGFVRTYGDISPGAPRFTGTVLRGAGDVLPWWRVVRADGSLAKGERQRALLDAEAVPFLSTATPRVDLRVCRIPDPG